MRIPIDRQSIIPLYRQVVEWLRTNIQNGSLPVDLRLPASRSLAEELGLSRITIKNAYAILESEGLLITREGSGTYVAPPLSVQLHRENKLDQKWPLWQIEEGDDLITIPFAPQIKNTKRDDLISFTGVGDPLQYPGKDFLKALQDVIRKDGTTALEYGAFGAGYTPLRETIARVLANQGIQIQAQQIMITSGSQQALALVCNQRLREGDVILVEKPTYNLALELFRLRKLKIIDVPVDENGMQVETIESLLQQFHPRLIYTIPNFQNPGGTCMSTARRRLLLSLAGCYNIPILEDDFVGDLRFEGHGLPAIKALDTNGQVIYTGTFSKMLMPGIRVGYLVADGPVFQKLVQQKFTNDLTTSPLIQRALDQYVTLGRYQAHLRRSIRMYRQRRDAMANALQQFLPTVSFVIPRGGLFLWVKIPAGISSEELLTLAVKRGVEFAPGTRFFANPNDVEGYIRLNFATNSIEKITLGVQRLADVLVTSGTG